MRIRTLSFCLLIAGTVLGADFKDGYISYTLTSPTTVSVTEVSLGFKDEWNTVIRDTAKFEVPETVEFRGRRLTVTAIGRNAFNPARIDTLILPHTITTISDYAFQNCPLKSINLPEGIQTIGDGCFSGCKLESIILPESLKTIGAHAFKLCPLKEIHLPKGVTTIGYEAFRACGELKEIDLPDSLKTLDNEAFAWCEKLQQITTHSDLKSIGIDCFTGCKSLKTVNWGGKVEVLGGFSLCTSLETITIPEGTQKIYARAFRGCTALREVVLPKSVREMGQAAFSGCTSLKEITLPAALLAIDTWTFQNCSSLETITFGENIESIGSESLEGCKNLKHLIMRSKKPCFYGASSFTQDIVDLFNRADISVPTGSKEAYTGYDFWKNFKTVTEYDPENLCAFFILTVKEGGTVWCNGESFGEGESTVVVPVGEPFELVFRPDDDHQISSVEHRYNYGIDYLKDQVKENRLILDLKQNSNVWVFFKAAKIDLDILQNEMGRVRLAVSKNRRYGCRVIEEEGWQVHSITFNGEDITGKGGKGNYIMTPVIKDNSVIRIAFEKAGTGIQAPLREGIRILGDADGVRIRNTQPGETIRIYSLDGQLLRTTAGTGGDIHLALRPGAVYIIQTDTKTIKIRL